MCRHNTSEGDKSTDSNCCSFLLPELMLWQVVATPDTYSLHISCSRVKLVWFSKNLSGRERELGSGV